MKLKALPLPKDVWQTASSTEASRRHQAWRSGIRRKIPAQRSCSGVVTLILMRGIRSWKSELREWNFPNWGFKSRLAGSQGAMSRPLPLPEEHRGSRSPEEEETRPLEG